jgi:ribonuclease HI
MAKKFYTDGACKGNPGTGGWGVYVEHTGEEFYGYNAETTNNRMELTGAIKALGLILEGEEAIIFCDSQYVLKGITEWIHGWKKNGWKSAKGAVKNQDLWQTLDKLNQDRKISWKWVKGHEDDVGNIKADALANRGATGENHDIPVLERNSEDSSDKAKAQKQVVKDTIVEIGRGDTLVNPVSGKHYYVLENALLLQTESSSSENRLALLLEIIPQTQKAEKELVQHVVTLSYLKQNYQKVEFTDELRKSLLKVLNIHRNQYDDLPVHLAKTCQHRVEFNESEDEDADGSYSGYCVVCNEYFGHYCPESPDHVCHYQTHAGKITLITGEEINAPEDHNPNYETWDMCIFCGGPEERK